MKNIKRKIYGLASVFLVLGLIINTIPVSAATDKILVTDNDGDNTISIGDKFCLGEECFYVTKNEDGNISALAEYNLYVGANYDKVVLDIDSIYLRYEVSHYDEFDVFDNPVYFFEGEEVSDESAWRDKIKEKYNTEYYRERAKTFLKESWIDGDEYEIDEKTFINETLKFYTVEYIDETTAGYALQSEQARGVTGEKGNANYPIYATNKIQYSINPILYVDGYYNFELDDTDPGYEGSGITKGYLNDYLSELTNRGYEISSIDMMNIEDINDLTKAITGDDLPLAEWYSAATADGESDDIGWYTNVGDLKEYLSEDYAWLWNTTFWLKSLTYVRDSYGYNHENDYFVSSAGEICYMDTCYNSIPRAGIRPVITMAADQFELNRLDISGTVRWVDNSDASKLRPNKSMIRLYRNGTEIDSAEVVKDEDEDLWRFSFKNLLKYDTSGELYTYTISQDGIAQYASDITNFDVVNEYAPESSDETTPSNPKTGDNSPLIYVGVISAISAGMFMVARRMRR